MNLSAQKKDMTSEEPIARLREAIEKRDIEIWNEWRSENINVKLNFSTAASTSNGSLAPSVISLPPLRPL